MILSFFLFFFSFSLEGETNIVKRYQFVPLYECNKKNCNANVQLKSHKSCNADESNIIICHNCDQNAEKNMNNALSRDSRMLWLLTDINAVVITEHNMSIVLFYLMLKCACTFASSTIRYLRTVNIAYRAVCNLNANELQCKVISLSFFSSSV